MAKVEIAKTISVYYSSTLTAFDPEYAGITKEAIDEYIKDHPFPDDPAYSLPDMIYDVTESSGMLILPDDITDETIEYMEKMLTELTP